MTPPNFGPAALGVAVPLIRGFEAYRARPYQDQRACWTYGYGNRTCADGSPVTYHTAPISMADAEMLEYATVKALAARMERLVTHTLLPCQAGALLSLDYNIGTEAFAGSTLLRKLNAGDMAGMEAQFLVWDECDGKVNAGLVARRAQERRICMGADLSHTAVVTGRHPMPTAPVS